MAVTVEELMQILFADSAFPNKTVDEKLTLAKDLSSFNREDYVVLKSHFNTPLEKYKPKAGEIIKKLLEKGLVVQFWTPKSDPHYGVTEKGKIALQVLEKVYTHQVPERAHSGYSLKENSIHAR